MVSFKGIFKKVLTNDQQQRSEENRGEESTKAKGKKKIKRRRPSLKSLTQPKRESEREGSISSEFSETNKRVSNEPANDVAHDKEEETSEEESFHEGESEDEEYESDLEQDDEDEDTLGVQFENPEERDSITRDPNTFKTLSPEEIIREQKNEVLAVTNLLEIPSSAAVMLLRHFHWKKERLIEQYFQNPERVCKEAGVVIDSTSNRDTLESSGAIQLSEGEMTCSICFMDVTPEECTALKCLHCFCNDCWKTYLKIKIVEGEVGKIKCPDKTCHLAVDENIVKKLVDEETYERYLRFITKSFVEDSDGRVKWCPQPNCGNAITVDMISGTVAKCLCGFRFCFSCHREAHNPATCEEVKLWQKKCKDDSETSHWKYANTKDCPKCESPVEKNGGCNHMTCRQCKHEWCWVCIRPWKGHNDYYNCNKFLKPEKRKASFSVFSRSKKKERMREREAERERNRIALERYLHFFERFMNHSHSSELEKQIRSRALAKVAELQNEAAMTSEVQYIVDGTEELLECRNVLKYTYVFAYYLPETGPEKELFEFLQEDLEKCTEELSEVLELSTSSSPSHRLKAMNIIHLAQTRKGNLLRAVEQGLTEDT